MKDRPGEDLDQDLQTTTTRADEGGVGVTDLMGLLNCPGQRFLIQVIEIEDQQSGVLAEEFQFSSALEESRGGEGGQGPFGAGVFIGKALPEQFAEGLDAGFVFAAFNLFEDHGQVEVGLNLVEVPENRYFHEGRLFRIESLFVVSVEMGFDVGDAVVDLTPYLAIREDPVVAVSLEGAFGDLQQLAGLLDVEPGGVHGVGTLFLF